MNYKTALQLAEQALETLRPFCTRIEIAGSIRRKCADVGDIEIVYQLKPEPDGSFGQPIMNGFWRTVCDKWKVQTGHRGGLYIAAKIPGMIGIDLFQATPFNWGLIYAIRTGSAEYSHRVLATGWTIKGYTSANGILYPVMSFGAKYGDVTPEPAPDYSQPRFMREEQDVFDLIGIPWKKPEDRI